MSTVEDDAATWRVPHHEATVVPWSSVKSLGDPDRFAEQVAAEVARLPRPAPAPARVGRHRRHRRSA